MTAETECSRLVDLLRKQAEEIAAAGHKGWGNTMLQAADYIESHPTVDAAGVGEAVASWHAYRWMGEDGTWSSWRVYRNKQSIPKGMQANGYEHVPLYIHPSPVEAAVERTDLAPVIRLHLNALWDSKIDAALTAQQKDGQS